MASTLRMRKVISPEQNRAVAAIDSRVVWNVSRLQVSSPNPKGGVLEDRDNVC